jgi:hypothetical protein
MSTIHGPAAATEQDVTFAWRGAEAAVETAVANPADEGAQRDAAAAFGGFLAASRSAEADLEAGQ